MTSTPRPVVALDVDGVLNFDGATDRHVLTIPATDQPKSPFLRGGGTKDTTMTVGIDPSVGPWITALREHADVVWATTWEEMANLYLAPLLGIDPLPLAMSVEANPPRFGYVKNADSIGWKASVLRDAYPGRPLVWADDGAWGYTTEHFGSELFDAGRPWTDWRTAGLPADIISEDGLVPAPALVLVPTEAHGLTLEHRATIDAFVAAPYDYKIEVPSWVAEDLAALNDL